MINIYLGTGPVSAYWNWEVNTGKDGGGRTHLQTDSLQILDLWGLAFSVIKSYLIFQESFLPQPLCTLSPTTGFTLIYSIYTLFLHCYSVGVLGMRQVETGWEGTWQKNIVFSMLQLQRLASLFYSYS